MRKQAGLAPPMRPMRHKCGQCKAPFRPNRSDAEFCSALCRQAAYRVRKSENSLKAKLQIAKNAHDANWRYEYYRAAAVGLQQEAAAYGIEHVDFVATPLGILVIENSPGAARLAVDNDDCDGSDGWSGGRYLRTVLCETECHSRDPAIMGALFS
jgi:hypothetical protein